MLIVVPQSGLCNLLDVKLITSRGMPFFTQYMADCGTHRILVVSYIFIGF